MTRQRTYIRTHPHLSFRLDLSGVGHEFWMLLGEAQSKCEHIAGTPLRPEIADRLHNLYLAKGALATTAIEGNTLTEEEARKRVEGVHDLPPSREYLGQEIDNVVRAINDLFPTLISGGRCEPTPERLQSFNRQILDRLSLADGVIPGVVRSYDVSVGRYRGAPPEDCDYLLERLCDWLCGPDFAAPKGQEIAFGILRAVVAHLYLAWIHPFGDGNGRTARLVEFQILVAVGVPSPAAHLLSNHYNRTRTEYYRQLDYSSVGENGAVSFLFYALQGFVDGLREQLDYIRQQQMEVTWRNYVHGTLGHEKSVTEDRRRHLVLDLTGKSEPTPISDLPNISGRVAQAYARVSSRTLMRDVSELVRSGYLVRTDKGLTANMQLITAFLPPRRIPNANSD